MIFCRPASPCALFASRCLLLILLIASNLFDASTVHAHSPFDSNAHITVMEQNLEASLVVGTGLTEQLLKDSGVGPLPNTGVGMGTSLPLQVAPRLFEIEVAGTNLPASQLRVLSDGLEATFVVIYPRPPSDTFRVHATFARHLPASGFSALVVTDDQNRMLGSHIVRLGSEIANFTLPPLPGTTQEVAATGAAVEPVAPSAMTAATAPSTKTQPSAAEYFQMGVHHILTGYDHLLFLCALLVACQRVKPMLVIITCFTVAHSITLALAAMDVVAISPRIVEPLIAASIVIVGVENFRGKTDIKTRSAITFGFGLIHGFGFAGALRESGLSGGGLDLVAPLFTFNVGVECGQLAVAGVFLPLLFFARRVPSFERRGTPAISACVVALGGFWLIQRLFT